MEKVKQEENKSECIFPTDAYKHTYQTQNILGAVAFWSILSSSCSSFIAEISSSVYCVIMLHPVE